MNKTVKFGFAALAAAACTAVCAQDVESIEEENEYEAIGWTPIALGIASPVQLPWGSHTWDVFGLDLNLIWSDAPKMYGIGFGGIAMATRDNLKGIQLASLCNWATRDVYGLRTTLGANISFGTVYGVDTGCFAYRDGDMWGVDIEFLGSYQRSFWGLQCVGILNLSLEQSYGASVAICGNSARVAYGCQLAAIFNYTQELHGCQIGLVNFASECPWGFQIGLVNIIMDNSLKVLPLINCYF
ncbi:MAG: hypothetical protein J6T01_02075 [Kiritimatiellae bacterium]|nr:hypothetical protein [Kiritimatiellia bacterium]